MSKHDRKNVTYNLFRHCRAVKGGCGAESTIAPPTCLHRSMEIYPRVYPLQPIYRGDKLVKTSTNQELILNLMRLEAVLTE